MMMTQLQNSPCFCLDVVWISGRVVCFCLHLLFRGWIIKCTVSCRRCPSVGFHADEQQDVRLHGGTGGRLGSLLLSGLHERLWAQTRPSPSTPSLDHLWHGRHDRHHVDLLHGLPARLPRSCRGSVVFQVKDMQPVTHLRNFYERFCLTVFFMYTGEGGSCLSTAPYWTVTTRCLLTVIILTKVQQQNCFSHFFRLYQ